MDRLYDAKLNLLIDEELSDFALNADGNLITVAKNAKRYKIYNDKGEFISQGDAYDSIVALGPEYFLAVGDSGYLKLYDYQGNEFVTVTKWKKNSDYVYFKV